MPIKTHGVANAARKHFLAAAIQITTHDGAVFVISGFATIARRANRNVELAVWTNAHCVRIVSGVIGQSIDYCQRRAGVVQTLLDLVKSEDAGAVSYEQRTVATPRRSDLSTL